MKSTTILNTKNNNSSLLSDLRKCIPKNTKAPAIFIPSPGCHRFFSACLDVQYAHIQFYNNKNILSIAKNVNEEHLVRVGFKYTQNLAKVNSGLVLIGESPDVLVKYKRLDINTFSKYVELYESKDAIIDSVEMLKAAFCGCHVCKKFEKLGNGGVVIDRIRDKVTSIKDKKIVIIEKDRILDCVVNIVFLPNHDAKLTDFTKSKDSVRFFHPRLNANQLFVSKQGIKYSQHSHCRYVEIKGYAALHYAIQAHLKALCGIVSANKRRRRNAPIFLRSLMSNHIHKPSTYLELFEAYPNQFNIRLLRFFVYSGLFMKNAVVTTHFLSITSNSSDSSWAASLSPTMVSRVRTGELDPFSDVLYLCDVYYTVASVLRTVGLFYHTYTSYSMFNKGYQYPFIFKGLGKSRLAKKAINHVSDVIEKLVVHSVIQHSIDSREWPEVSNNHGFRLRRRKFRNRDLKNRFEFMYYGGYDHSKAVRKFAFSHIKTIHSTKVWCDEIAFISSKDDQVFKSMKQSKIKRAEQFINSFDTKQQSLKRRISKIKKSKLSNRLKEEKIRMLKQKASKQYHNKKQKIRKWTSDLNDVSNITLTDTTNYGYGTLKVTKQELAKERRKHDLEVKRKELAKKRRKQKRNKTLKPKIHQEILEIEEQNKSFVNPFITNAPSVNSTFNPYGNGLDSKSTHMLGIQQPYSLKQFTKHIKKQRSKRVTSETTTSHNILEM